MEEELQVVNWQRFENAVKVRKRSNVRISRHSQHRDPCEHSALADWHRLPHGQSESKRWREQNVLLQTRRWGSPRVRPSAICKTQREDEEMRSAPLLKLASCRQMRQHAGTGSSHQRQSTKIAKYYYGCVCPKCGRACVRVSLSLAMSGFHKTWVNVTHRPQFAADVMCEMSAAKISIQCRPRYNRIE